MRPFRSQCLSLDRGEAFAFSFSDQHVPTRAGAVALPTRKPILGGILGSVAVQIVCVTTCIKVGYSVRIVVDPDVVPVSDNNAVVAPPEGE